MQVNCSVKWASLRCIVSIQTQFSVCLLLDNFKHSKIIVNAYLKLITETILWYLWHDQPFFAIFLSPWFCLIWKNRLKRLLPFPHSSKVKLYFPSSTYQIIPATWFSPISHLLIISLETDTSPVWKGMQSAW